MTITWGEVSFDGPTSMGTWEPPRRAAVYAIMMKPDVRNKPDTYRVIYFGESENLSERGFWRSHHKYECWRREAGSDENLFIGVHPMPNSSQIERRTVESGLIAKYNPTCNET